MRRLETDDPETFIRENTVVEAPCLVPEIRLHLVHEITPIWEATEKEMNEADLAPPYWAFAWAGGQALARYVLDNPEVVAGKTVLDFAAGGGIAGIAAHMAGAARVLAADIDPFAAAALVLNAEINGVSVEITTSDLIDAEPAWDVVLAGDICYEGPTSLRAEAWFRRLAGAGVRVYIGDPGRTYLPKEGLEKITAYAVRTTRAIEDTDLRNACVWQVLPATRRG
ncbi:MAG TPA: 50S ribosomal protein L11 methyltransferase [Alphaproteobacteria bacterium]|nr:50S ribosomal protein L11 methyltransferase [Alphaproteobacteria bacterium]